MRARPGEVGCRGRTGKRRCQHSRSEQKLLHTSFSCYAELWAIYQLSCFRVLRLGYTGRTFGDKCLLHERCDRKATRAQYLNSIQSSSWQERPKSIFISLPIRGVPPLLTKPRSSGASFCLHLLRNGEAARCEIRRHDAQSLQRGGNPSEFSV